MVGVEPLREYQDYLLAYRLRARTGGGLRPTGPRLQLWEYARLRLKRQSLARDLLGSGDYRQQMGEIDTLTDRINFGFWHNPNETAAMLRRVVEAGGCRALESEQAFVAELLTESERIRLGPGQRRLLASYYLGLVRAAAAHLDAAVFTRLRAEVETLRERLPLFFNVADEPPAGSVGLW